MLLGLKVEASGLKGAGLKDVNKRIAVVEGFINERKTEVGKELRLLEEKQNVLQERLVSVQAELAMLPSLSAEDRRLRRERDGDEEQYRIYRRRLHDARLSNEMDSAKIASINIIQPASPAPAPIWPPSKGVSFVIAILLAAVAGFLVVTLIESVGPTGVEWLDRDLETSEVQ